MKKRMQFLAGMLAFAMTVSTLQMPAAAAEVPETQILQETETVSETEVAFESQTETAAETAAQTETMPETEVLLLETAQTEAETETETEALLAEAAETESETAGSLLPPGTHHLDLSDIQIASSDELFGQYVDLLFGQKTEEEILLEADRQRPATRLSGYNLKVYNILKKGMEAVAAGNRTSTVFEVSPKDLGLASKKWAPKDIGLKSFNVSNVGDKFYETLDRTLKLDMDAVMNCLLAELPYDAYWFDITAGIEWTDFGADYTSDGKAIRLTDSMEFYFYVAEDYQYDYDEFTVNPSKVVKAKRALTNALSVVTKYKAQPDYQKLVGYKNEICNLVEYDYDAVEYDYAYGDSWQLVNVFDRDPSTNVVCEGYAKAFKLLCDRTSFSGDISCSAVGGYMGDAYNEDAHMWNVVSMENGGNYLVDITNCDTDSIGYPDKLFLLGLAEPLYDGSVQYGYVFVVDGESIYYSYDEYTLHIFDYKDLTIAPGKYDPNSFWFRDVMEADRYFYEPVYWAVRNGITNGYGGKYLFSPNAYCTREQIVTFLWRLMGEPAPSTHASFTDVKASDWFCDAISWAAENGITTGLNDGTGRFGVGQPCRREQCVTFLYRTAGSPAVESSDVFTDVPANAYYAQAVTWAAQNGVTTGLNDGTGRFGVGQKCTRAMIVSFLYRYANLSR